MSRICSAQPHLGCAACCCRSLARLLRTLFREDMRPSRRMMAGTQAWLAGARPAVPGQPGSRDAGAVTGLGALHLLHALVVHGWLSLPGKLVQVLTLLYCSPCPGTDCPQGQALCLSARCDRRGVLRAAGRLGVAREPALNAPCTSACPHTYGWRAMRHTHEASQIMCSHGIAH